jgi:hypothetical protein
MVEDRNSSGEQPHYLVGVCWSLFSGHQRAPPDQSRSLARLVPTRASPKSTAGLAGTGSRNGFQTENVTWNPKEKLLGGWPTIVVNIWLIYGWYMVNIWLIYGWYMVNEPYWSSYTWNMPWISPVAGNVVTPKSASKQRKRCQRTDLNNLVLASKICGPPVY